MVEPTARYRADPDPPEGAGAWPGSGPGVLGVPRWWPTGARVGVAIAHGANSRRTDPPRVPPTQLTERKFLTLRFPFPSSRPRRSGPTRLPVLLNTLPRPPSRAPQRPDRRTGAPLHRGKGLGARRGRRRERAAAHRRPLPDGVPAASAGRARGAPGRPAVPHREPDPLPHGSRDRAATSPRCARRWSASERRREIQVDRGGRPPLPGAQEVRAHADDLQREILARSTTGSGRSSAGHVSGAADLYFQQIPVGEMANLAYLVGSRSTREALVVDPAWSVDALLDRAEADGMNVVGALVTHYHQDHVGGELFGIEIEGLDAPARAQPGADPRERARGRGRAARDGRLRVGPRAPRGGDVIELGACACGCCTRPATRPARSASWSRSRAGRAASSPATRSSSAAAAASTCRAATRRRCTRA